MLLKNCRLIPELSDSIPFETADIQIEDRKITHIFPAGKGLKEDVEQEEVIDCRGCTVLPGLIDLHVHLVPDRSAESLYAAFELYHDAASMLGRFLDKGITTVRDCGSTMDLAIYLREAVDRGLFTGPRILTSGQIISPEAMRHGGEESIHFIANGTEEVMKAARRMFAEGADFIKIYASQSIHQVRGQDPKPIFSPEEIETMVRVAEDHNSYVAAHAHSAAAINRCLKAGVRSIEHATYMDEESIQLFLSRKDAWPVLTHACSALYERGEGKDPEEEIAFWTRPDIIESSRRCRAGEGRAFSRGVLPGVGTDLYPSNCDKYPYEFQIRRQFCGMTDLDILKQATMISAEIAMIGDQVGQVREGYCADLIAVNGRPDEDILLLHDSPVLVIKDGAVHRNRLPLQREDNH